MKENLWLQSKLETLGEVKNSCIEDFKTLEFFDYNNNPHKILEVTDEYIECNYNRSFFQKFEKR